MAKENSRTRRPVMLFVTLLSAKGTGNEPLKSLKKLKAPAGIVVKATHFTFGRYDAVIIFEATDPKAAMKFAVSVGSATDHTTETLVAIPAEEL